MFTCTVGKKPSAAANYLHDVTEVQELLDALVKVSSRDQKYYSSVDLRSYAQELGYAKTGADTYDAPAMGMTKSLSLGQLSATDPAEEQKTQAISMNLGEYLGTIEDGADDEDDGMFF